MDKPRAGLGCEDLMKEHISMITGGNAGIGGAATCASNRANIEQVMTLIAVMCQRPAQAV